MRYILFALAVFGLIMADILADIPGCDYFDTVDLTNSQQFANGSYQYQDILITKDKTGQYDYEILFNGKVEKVLKHTRGCVCQEKSCVRFCCDPQKLLVPGERKCENIENLTYNTVLNITLNNGTKMEKNVTDFIVQQHLPVPCDIHLHLYAERNKKHGWTLFENGTMFRHNDNKSLSKRDYCLQPYRLPDKKLKLVPHICIPPPDRTNAYIQMVSVLFMIIIIVVNLLLPNFKSVHGKCCTCYFICLTVAFLMLITASFQWIQKTNGLMCYLVGYSGYFAVMAAFLWLLIINYNLWKSFNNIRVGRKSRFLKYNIFVWSVAAVLLGITSLVDLANKTRHNDTKRKLLWKPGVGLYSCWIKTFDWSAMIFYYGPLLILVICNIILFIITASRIFMENKKNRNQLKQLDCQRNLRNRTNFAMFVRLFVIVGVIWIVEIISYICPLLNIYSLWVQIADFVTSAQGVVLFIVTILKKDVLKSLVDRFRAKRPHANTSRTSNTSQLPTECSLLAKSPRTSSSEKT